MKRYLIYAILVLTGTVIILSFRMGRLKADRNRLEANNGVLMSGVQHYRTRDSLSAAGVERLTLSNREFARYCGELERTVSDLNIRVKRLQSVSQTATETKYIVNTLIRDSITPGDTLRCVDYRDAYLTFSGCIRDDRFAGLVESRDTIVQVVHRVPRRFWFIRWGTKAIRQEVVCRNPHSRITYTQYIELK